MSYMDIYEMLNTERTWTKRKRRGGEKEEEVKLKEKNEDKKWISPDVIWHLSVNKLIHVTSDQHVHYRWLREQHSHVHVSCPLCPTASQWPAGGATDHAPSQPLMMFYINVEIYKCDTYRIVVALTTITRFIHLYIYHFNILIFISASINRRQKIKVFHSSDETFKHFLLLSKFKCVFIIILLLLLVLILTLTFTAECVLMSETIQLNQHVKTHWSILHLLISVFYNKAHDNKYRMIE